MVLEPFTFTVTSRDETTHECVVRMFGNLVPLGGGVGAEKLQVHIDVHGRYCQSLLRVADKPLVLVTMSRDDKKNILQRLADDDYLMNGVVCGNDPGHTLVSFGGLALYTKPALGQNLDSHISVLLTTPQKYHALVEYD
jgi:hypothetical protein